ncbi:MULTISPECIES: ThiF family adenylyltransferase [Streptomyces]|uniref:ThiF family adenylyltransferase n=1 Tax=Streptomyces TaxID=1883 RepID=UPI0015C5125D|nr:MULTISPECIES: ThiF family adenylyltransferase [Streptomyces]MDX3637133.1 ThiF family adenylyltransferase [Streptomyces europaeiscabiei]MDX3655277.1 ThiF family adenylyltransferase [Streptomyces europaeiscabiei]WRZ53625.1 ThiF family adenylyltransferase [Streptomyces sp. NBC_01314]
MITRFSVATTTDVALRLTEHLRRADGQEDCCFVLWRPSTGSRRTTALIVDLVLPEDGERIVHGTVDFTSAYFLRAAGIATERGCGLGFIHSHPRGRRWQRLNAIDHAAEESFAAQPLAITGLPLVGLTFAGADAGYGARIWQQHAPRTYVPTEAENVRVVGGRFAVTFNDRLVPVPKATNRQLRTVSAWGRDAQNDLARLHVGVVGTGSVGMIVVEALARTGIQNLSLFDFDTVEDVNLDRLLHATPQDVRLHRAKVDLAERAAHRAATATDVRVTTYETSVVEPDGYAAATDCDVLFSCVDRPWPRAALNLLAYAHLIPVVDGGIAVDARGGRMNGAEWRAHVAAPGRACMECLGQYDPAHVAVERDGLLDDPTYIKGLAADHPLRRKENVFIFSANAAAAQLNQFLTMTTAPGGIADTGAHLYHLTTGSIDRRLEGCAPECPYHGRLRALGDHTPVSVTRRHHAAEQARDARRQAARRWPVRLRRAVDDLIAGYR